VSLGEGEVEDRLREYWAVRPFPGLDDLWLLETALFLEETLGIRLSEEEISQENLGTFEDIRRLAAEHRRRA
jgi:acyl carrier protein